MPENFLKNPGRKWNLLPYNLNHHTVAVSLQSPSGTSVLVLVFSCTCSLLSRNSNKVTVTLHSYSPHYVTFSFFPFSFCQGVGQGSGHLTQKYSTLIYLPCLGIYCLLLFSALLIVLLRQTCGLLFMQHETNFIIYKFLNFPNSCILGRMVSCFFPYLSQMELDDGHDQCTNLYNKHFSKPCPKCKVMPIAKHEACKL